jgi:hypothetical protein
MNPQLQQAISRCRDAGQQDYARWDDKLFQQLCRGPVEYFWEKTSHDLPGTEAYLSALAEGMAHGYVTQSADPKNYQFFATYMKWQSLLEFWLVLRVPLEFPRLKPGERPTTMAKLWNLGENILRDQPWIDRYLLKLNIESPAGLSDIERQLSVWLEPVLKPAVSARWEPPFTVRIIDGRTIRDDFIPGEMHLSAPALVCIRDRRLPDIFGGVFLHEGNGRVITHHRDLGGGNAEPQVDIEVRESQVKIQGHTVELPNLGQIHSWLMCANRAAVFTAVDSQRIWLVRSQ